MDDTIYITKLDETYVQVTGDSGILRELSNKFTFLVEGAAFMPSVVNRLWDGKIRLLDLRNGKIYLGLHKEIKDWCDENGYTCIYEDPLDVETQFSVVECRKMVQMLDLSRTTDTGKEDIEVHDYQEKAIIHSIQANRSLLLSPTACHAAGTQILMYDGSLKVVEKIQIGDQLMGPDSKPRNVLRLFNGNDDMYRVHPKARGDDFVVNKNHILSLMKINEGKTGHHRYASLEGTITNLSVDSYLNRSRYFKHVNKLYHSNEIEFPTSPILPIDPYFLGVLLGDGSLQYQIGITTADDEIKQETYKQADIFDLKIRESWNGSAARTYYFKKHNPGILYEYKITHPNGLRTITNSLYAYCIENDLKYEAMRMAAAGMWKNRKGFIVTKSERQNNSLTDKLRFLGLYGIECGEKFIPGIYKTATIKQRCDILAGLIDTDGSLSNGVAYDFCVKSKQLIEDTTFIARSLGLAVTQTKPRIINNEIYYRIYIGGSIEKIPVRLPHKKKTRSLSKMDHLRSGFELSYIGKDQYYGFELDGDHLYLLSDFTVTHNSGKSLIIYALVRYYLARTKGKILIVVPTSNLVDQMYRDFEDYAFKINWNVEDYCHRIYDGSEKHTEKRVVITTWQSLAIKKRLSKEIRSTMKKWQIEAWNKQAPYILDQEWFDQFETVVGDECHLFAAEELTKIMVKLVNARHRHGTTGTLKDAKANRMILEGLFGKVYQTTTTQQMIDDGKAAQLEINILQLEYSPEERKLMKKATYQEEMEFLQAHEGRTNFICNLALSLHGNTLVLYEKVEKHGQLIYNNIESNKEDQARKLFFVHGEIKPDERNEIRFVAEEETNAIIVASYGTFSTGVNIRNIDNIISVATGKSKIRLFQSIGRGLRLSLRKIKMRWYDIADDLSQWNKSRTEVRDNYSLQHLQERISYYSQEHFDYKTYKINL